MGIQEHLWVSVQSLINEEKKSFNFKCVFWDPVCSQSNSETEAAH